MAVTAQLFGKAGDIYPQVLRDIVSEGAGTTYRFMDVEHFKDLPTSQMNTVYWQEILYRVHWAAIANAIRHLRWFDACIIHSTSHPNYLAFCAALRGLLESAADTTYSLGTVPLTMASSSNFIIKALNGSFDNSPLISTELENCLIHFHHARKVKNTEVTPAIHKAETAAKYISAIEHLDFPVRELYSELCQVTHPAEHSLHWLSYECKNGWVVGRQDDIGSIHKLMKQHKATVNWIQQNSGNITILLCKVLNSLPLKKLHISSVKSWDMNKLPLHQKVKKEFSLHGIKWP